MHSPGDAVNSARLKATVEVSNGSVIGRMVLVDRSGEQSLKCVPENEADLNELSVVQAEDKNPMAAVTGRRKLSWKPHRSSVLGRIEFYLNIGNNRLESRGRFRSSGRSNGQRRQKRWRQTFRIKVV